jgi:lipopolysaccharide export system protein LptC
VTSALLILAVLLSSWSIIISRSSQETDTRENPKEADSYMENIQAIILNKDGKPSLKLVAPKMVHYPENDSTEMTTPRVTIYRHSPKPWYIDSDYAKTKDGINEIQFSQNVYIHHPADTENPTTSMTTDTLTIFPNKQLASTDQAITFIQPDTTIHAIGMLANLNEGTIKLLSQAKGEYVPAS